MLGAIAAFFALWEVGFWFLVILASVVFIVCSEKDLLWLGLFTTAVMVVIYHAALVVLLANPLYLALGVIGWLVVGVIYSVVAWQRYITRKVKEKNEFTDLRYALALNRNKSRITNWIIFWPWSLFWNLTGNLFNNIFEAMSGVYQKMVDKALAPLEVAEKQRKIEEEAERQARDKRREEDELARRRETPYNRY